MDSDLQRAEQRFGISIPDSYSNLVGTGAFSWGGPENVHKYLFLSDLEWLTPAEIAGYEFLFDYPCIVPFAVSARRDEWAWYPAWCEAGESAVVFRERGMMASGYAPTFEAFLFRRLLEELAETWLPEDPGFGPDGALQQIRCNIELARSVIRPQWYEVLVLKVGPSPVLRESEDGDWSLISWEESQSVAAVELQWPHLDEEFTIDE
jgi:hypothetical protein